MYHIVLLGDSIFDNAAYVGGGPDVIRQLRGLLPAGWRASLLAVDGARTSAVADQLARLPRDASHLAVSVGGNDALSAAYLLSSRVETVADALNLLADAQDQFHQLYKHMLRRVLATGLPAALCAIYDTPPSSPDHRIIKTALSLFNDRITRDAFSNRLPLIDLRLLCSEDKDYANPIEPSVQGGAKIAAAISAWALGPKQDWRRPLMIAAAG